MKNRVAVLSSLVALSLVGPLGAQVPQVVDGPDLFAVGTVLSIGNTSMAIRTQDHGHAISFVISTTTVLPTNLAVGSQVRVDYHAVGATEQVADKVTLLTGPPPARSEFAGASGVQPRASAPPQATAAAPASGASHSPRPGRDY